MNPRVLVIEQDRPKTGQLDDDTIRGCLQEWHADSAGHTVAHADACAIQRMRFDAAETFHRVPCDMVILEYSRDGKSAEAGMSGRLPADVPVILLVDQDDLPINHESFRDTDIDVVVRTEDVSQQLRNSLSRATFRTSILRTSQDLSRAAAVQRAMLPGTPPATPDLDIAAKWLPAVEVGGDFYDFVVGHDESVNIVIGDVTGHGLTAALRMAETQAYVRAFLHCPANQSPDPAQVLAQVNQLLAASTAEIPLLATALIATWLPHERTLRWCAAGHQGILLRSSGEIEILSSTGPVLGCLESVEYRELRTDLVKSGDTLLLATDGIAESAQDRRNLFGRDRIIECLRHSWAQPSAVALDHLFQTAQQFHGNDDQQDDMTAVLVKFR